MAFSIAGRVDFRTEPYGGPSGPLNPWYWISELRSQQVERYRRLQVPPQIPLPAVIGRSQHGFTVHYAIMGFACVIVAGMSGLPYRFSLQTLLVATTLVAVGMGLAVWASR